MNETITERRDKCSECGGRAEGWENGWRLRLCFSCAARMRDCNGDLLDYSPDDPQRDSEYSAMLAEAKR